MKTKATFSNALVLTPLTCACWLAFITPTVAAPPPVDFAHDVVPILKKHCVECHGERESKGGFSLNTRELLLDAEAAVPRKSAASRMIELIDSTDTEEQMPPKDRPRVSPAEASLLRRWIDEGLTWESGYSFGVQSYEPPLHPRRPELPPVVAGNKHPVDRIIAAYWQQQQIAPPEVVDDAAFLRRVHLDLIGLLPEPDALQSFLADADPHKRERVVRELLADNYAYAEHWLTFWNDLLRNDYTGTGFITGGRKQITNWLYTSLVENKPYDEFARQLIAPTAASEGFINGIRWRGNVNSSQTPEVQFAQNIGQAFLGINLKCASCHDSFIDRWTLAETYGLAQIFSTEPLELHRCDKPTGKLAEPAWLFPQLGKIDTTASQPARLQQLAALMTHADNGRFTRTIVNRLWHRLLGRGIVHPVDAMQTAPWNSDLLDFLAVHLTDNNYDLKQTLELICTSQAYQSVVTPVDEADDATKQPVFRGPIARRLTAEQFVDAVWQVTNSAPLSYDADVVRFAITVDTAANISAPTGRWVWSTPEAAAAVPPAGETMTVRHRFELPSVPKRAAAVITCDNEYTLFVNGRRIHADANWETVEVLPLTSVLRKGANEVLIVAKNAGNSPNPAGLFCELRVVGTDESTMTFGTNNKWEWTKTPLDARGRFRKPPEDWQPVAEIANPQLWSNRVGPQITAALSAVENAPVRMVRAALRKNTAFMRALGRPNRDQIVSMRPTELTTLEAIDLANGQEFADAIYQGAQAILAEHSGSSEQLLRRLMSRALTRQPTESEIQLGRELLGAQPTAQNVEDLLWSLFMLPEFQLIR